MANKIGIRSEEKHWDSRVSISPADIEKLPDSITIYFQNDGERALPFKKRVFSNEEILQAGRRGGAKTEIVNSLDGCSVVIGTKEIKEVYVKLDRFEYDFLKEIAPQIEHPVPQFVFDDKLQLIRLTDFLFENEKEYLIEVTKGTIVENIIKRLISKQESLIQRNKTYLFFTHTHKGQDYNMRMLKQFVDKECTLLDYELLKQEINGKLKRTVSYGKWAGIVGLLDTLWAYGEHLYLKEELENPFRRLRDAKCYDSEKFEYANIAQLKEIVQQISEEIKEKGLALPIKIGITGFRGEVGHGVIDVLENWGLPVVEFDADKFLSRNYTENFDFERNNKIYVIKLDYHHLYRPKTGADISEQAIKAVIKSGKGHLLESNLDTFFTNLSILINCIVWNKESPRLLTNSFLRKVFDTKSVTPHQILPVIGDISCDPCGSIECCRDTYPNNPVYLWIPDKSEEPILPEFDLKKLDDDYKYFDLSQYGFVVMAVTNLPCEIPRDASMMFSHEFCRKRDELGGKSYLECLATANFDSDFQNCGLPDRLKDSVILYKGKFNKWNSQLLLKDICLAMIATDTVKAEQVLPMLI